MGEDGIKKFLKRMFPKILKATVMGLFWFCMLYLLPMLLLSGLVEQVFPSYSQLISGFAMVIVVFVVLSELLAGTVFQHALNIGKALVFMVYFIYALNGGFIAFDFQSIRIEADVRIYLAMLLTINFLGLAKSLFRVIDFLGKRTERQLTI